MNEFNHLQEEIARLKAENERLQQQNKMIRDVKRDLHETLLSIHPPQQISENELIERMANVLPFKSAVMDQLESWIKLAKDCQDDS